MKRSKQLLVDGSNSSSLSFADWMISAFLLLSGASALIYQVLWVRLLTLSIGSTSVSISIVLSVFFLGLGLGSYFAGALIRRFKDALKIYIFAEAGIALCAVAILPILLNLDHFISLLPIVEAGIWMKFFIVVLLLIIPTFLIGVTFPLLAAIAIHDNSEIGHKLAHFYAFNSVGAVIGTLSSALVLIPHLGLDGSMYVAALLNISIVLIGTLQYGRLARSTKKILQPLLEKESNGVNNKALFVLFVTGFSAMATEVGWMKFLIVYTGNTIYGFSLILAMFIAGITIGSFIAKLKIISNVKNLEVFLFFGVILLAVALIGARIGLASFAEIYQWLNSFDADPFVYRWSKYLAMFLILLPAAALFGVLFPMSIKYYSPNADMLYSNVGRAYAVNIIAGIFGSIAAGFWIIPYFSTDILLTSVSIVVLFSGLIFFRSFRISYSSALWGGSALAVLTLSLLGARMDFREMVNIVLQREIKTHHGNLEPNIIYIKEGQSGAITLHNYSNDQCRVILSNNGMSESWIDMCKSENMLMSEFFLAQIPLFLNPGAKDAFILGYGGGTTARAMGMSDLERIDVVELDPAVIGAIKRLYDGRLPTQDDKRINIKINDARESLLLSNTRYDIIVSQPSHPWLMGASNIMNKDFFEIARSRLSQNGIHGQWVPLFKIDVATLKSIIKAYTDTFGYVVSFVNTNTRDFLMFGSNQPIVLNREAIEKQMQNYDAKRVFVRHNIQNANDLTGYFALSREELVSISASAEAATDRNLLAETFFSRYDSVKGNSFDTLGFLKGHFSDDISTYFKD